MLLDWYAVQKQIEAREAEVTRATEIHRQLREARVKMNQVHRPARPGLLRVTLGRLVVALGMVLRRGIDSGDSSGGVGAAPSIQ